MSMSKVDGLMASQTAELDWDHSVGENLLPTEDDLSDDFDEVNFYNGALLNDSMVDDQDAVKLSRRHLSFLVRSLEEAGSLLREQRNLQLSSQPNHRGHQRNTTETDGNKCKQSWSKVFTAVTKYNLIVTLALQAVMLVIVSIIDSTTASTHSNSTHSSDDLEKSNHKWSTYFVMLFICTLNLILVIYISVQLTKTMIKSRATALMLAQAYLSTVTMFAGLYVITYRIDRKSWTLHGFNTARDDEEAVIEVTYLFLKMLFHSISTSTLCGASTIHPDAWYNFILMSIQMLLSFLYFTSILRVVTTSSRSKANKRVRLRRNASMTSINSRVSTDQTRLLNGSLQRARYGGL